jgi:hypothetical protein
MRCLTKQAAETLLTAGPLRILALADAATAIERLHAAGVPAVHGCGALRPTWHVIEQR